MSGNGFKLTPELMQVIQAGMQKHLDLEMARKAESFHKLNRFAAKGGIVFAGDSITEYFPVYELFASDQSVLNRGIGGITSKQLLEKLGAHVLELMPKKLVLLIGTNDLGQGFDAERIVERIQQICEQATEKCHGVEIYLLSLLPVSALPQHAQSVGIRDNLSIQVVNRSLKMMAGLLPEVVYLDIYSHFTDEDGNLDDRFTVDGLHLSVEGYLLMKKLLDPYLKD